MAALMSLWPAVVTTVLCWRASPRGRGGDPPADSACGFPRGSTDQLLNDLINGQGPDQGKVWVIWGACVYDMDM